MTIQDSSRLSWLVGRNYAHRGLFEANSQREENTLSAIKAALAGGFGIEIDVQASRNGDILVFHDFTLDRLTDGSGDLSALSLNEIKKYTVRATGAPIPTLSEALACIDGQAPLLIEIKSQRGLEITPICKGVERLLTNYKGDVAIMSFDPRIVRWFRLHAPEVSRGWIVSNEALKGITSTVLRPYVIQRMKPDFVACDIRELPNNFAKKWRRAENPLLTWTVRTKDQEATGLQHTDGLIFEAPAVVGQTQVQNT